MFRYTQTKKRSRTKAKRAIRIEQLENRDLLNADYMFVDFAQPMSDGDFSGSIEYSDSGTHFEEFYGPVEESEFNDAMSGFGTIPSSDSGGASEAEDGGWGGYNEPPAISATAWQDPLTLVWTIEGTVVDNGSVSGLQVTLMGSESGSATTDANGNFTITSSPLQSGQFWVSVIDDDGYQSEWVQV